MSGPRRPDFAAPTSTRKQREQATATACERLSHHPGINGIVVVTRWDDGSFLVSSRAKGPAEDRDLDRILRRMAIEAIGDTTS